jgi:mono/diheme cytochrome c family protein
MNARIVCVGLLAVVTWSCVGDGTGLAEYDPAELRMSATLSSIQENIFTPLCIQCHTGPSAPLGLALDSAAAYQNLVEVRSSQVPTLMRVNRYKPDSSFLVWKIEDRSGIIGGRMPLGLPKLSHEQIAIIRGWIEGGAQAN